MSYLLHVCRFVNFLVLSVHMSCESVTLFFICAALAIMLDFFLQITAFVALIVFDCKRAADKRIDCFPCIKVSSSSRESVEGYFWKFLELVSFKLYSI